MKLKFVSIVASGVFLLTPFAAATAWAQNNPANSLPIMTGVNLTPQQENQLSQIRNQARSQIQSILTLEQRNQFITALQKGQSFRAAIAAMNLSSSQQTQLRTVFQSARKQMGDVLTPQQKQQFMQNVRSRLMQSF
ncbi:Spy/CpxP family protein refolding chaperone [Leptothermofonsia sp. ETS-13]|uniref:Spy/CpxP family protein refolding chaperone n=1 Tax=Leptothermofonsia sp. ETS-13 TaxID=3035696 RepID=UPI003BA25130